MTYFRLNGNVKIPIITIGTSPFIGAGQFGARGYRWRQKFLNNPELMSELMIKANKYGATGVEMIPIGKIPEAVNLVRKKFPNYVVLSSTHWSKVDIEFLATDCSSALIFLHGNLSDQRNSQLINSYLEQIRNYNIIPGIATHEPLKTLNFVFHEEIKCQVFLIPFNKAGYFMKNQKKLEKIIDNSSRKFIAMKSLAAGKLNPRDAFEYLASHNISGVSVGLISHKEIKETVPAALEALTK
ncbi:MAG: hypothetical protein GF329_19265 [Candidatus Lokiarchaeota archaeon]|nr:hypothetical protein [Candidatus Lokiarchaeota archaeon]